MITARRFLPAYPAPITYNDQENAKAKRISGAIFPTPKNADGRLAEIVLKACAFDPKGQHASPMQMRQELEAILYNREEAPFIYPQGDEAPIKSVEYLLGSAQSHENASVPPQEKTESIFGGIMTTVESPVAKNAHAAKQENERTASVFGGAVEPQKQERNNAPIAVQHKERSPLLENDTLSERAAVEKDEIKPRMYWMDIADKTSLHETNRVQVQWGGHKINHTQAKWGTHETKPRMPWTDAGDGGYVRRADNSTNRGYGYRSQAAAEEEKKSEKIAIFVIIAIVIAMALFSIFIVVPWAKARPEAVRFVYTPSSQTNSYAPPAPTVV